MQQIERKSNEAYHIVMEIDSYSLASFAFVASYFCSKKRKSLKRDDLVQWKYKTADFSREREPSSRKRQRLFDSNGVSIYWGRITDRCRKKNDKVSGEDIFLSTACVHEQITETTLQSIFWACHYTPFYGKRRGRLFCEYLEDRLKSEVYKFLENIEKNVYSWETTVLPPTFYELQARLTQREFVATVHGMCMADILAFTYISIFMVEALAVDALKLRLISETPQVLRWYKTMHSYLRSVFLDNANAKSAAMNTISKNLFKTGLCVQPLEDAMIEWFLPNSDLGKKLELNLQSVSHGVRSRPTAKKRTQKAKRQDKANFARKLHETQWDFLSAATKDAVSPVSIISSKIRSFINEHGETLNDEVIGVSHDAHCHVVEDKTLVDEIRAEWELTIPKILNPMHYTMGKLKDDRRMKKKQQVTNILAWVNKLLPKQASRRISKKRKISDTNFAAVDFCCGSGHVGLALAALRPDVTVIFIDCNPISISLAQSRAAESGIKNVQFLTMDIRDFEVSDHPGIKVGFALHACGPATDYALQKCLQAGASYVFAPCCVGFIQNESEYSRRLPCSTFFREKCKIKRDEFLVLARYADHTSVASEEGNQAMLLVNEDRNCLAKEHGYKTSHTRMQPLTCTPKNFLMVGVK